MTQTERLYARTGLKFVCLSVPEHAQHYTILLLLWELWQFCHLSDGPFRLRLSGTSLID